MTWRDFALYFDDTITDEEGEYLLWSETAFPMGDIKMVAQQLMSAIRAKKNNVSRCDMCLRKKPFHKRYCLNQ